MGLVLVLDNSRMFVTDKNGVRRTAAQDPTPLPILQFSDTDSYVDGSPSSAVG